MTWHLRLSCLVLLAAAFAQTPPADAAPSVPPDAAIPAQPLASAILDLSEQTGATIIADGRLLKGRRSPTVAQEANTLDTLRALLDGTGLAAREISAGTLVITQVEDVRQTGLTYASAVETAPAPPPEPPLLPASQRPAIVILASLREEQAFQFAPDTVTLPTAFVQYDGAPNVADALYDLPVFRASFSRGNTNLLGTPAGINLADLRGLGPSRTLVLVDGRRRVQTLGGNGTITGVDLNGIGQAQLGRIEITERAAPAEYGGDAAAGVVNFVRGRDLDGVKLSAEAGLTEQGDSPYYALSAVYGLPVADGAGRVIFSAEVDHDPELQASERYETASPYGFALNGRDTPPENGGVLTRGFGGSRLTPAGGVQGYIDGDGNFVRFPNSQNFSFNDDGSVRDYDGTLAHRYNWTEDFALLIPVDRILLSAYGDVELGSHRAWFSADRAQTDVEASLGALPVTAFQGVSAAITGDAVLVPINNPGVSQDLRDRLASLGANDIDSIVLERRFVELGPRIRSVERDSNHLGFGISGPLAGAWDYDVHYQYGRSAVRDLSQGYVNADRLAVALDPALCAEARGCSVINLFAAPRMTPEQADFIRAEPQRRRLTSNVHALSMLAEYQGPSTTAVIGAELRQEGVQADARLASARETVGDLSFADTEGTFGVASLYGTYARELLSGVPLAESLEISAAGRLEEYTATGTLLNLSGGLSWAPVPGFRLFGGYARGQRAPNLSERFSNSPFRFFFVFDPCIAPETETVAAGCASDGPLGVPADFQPRDALVANRQIGNSQLGAEETRSWYLGGDIGLGGLNLSLKWYDYQTDEVVTVPSAFELLASCYQSAGLSDRFCGTNPDTGMPYIVRDEASGELLSVDQPVINGGGFDLSGLAARVDWRMPVGTANLTMSVMYDYVDRAEQRFSSEADPFKLAGTVAFPRHRAFGQAILDWDDLTTTLAIEYRGSAASEFGDGPESRLAEALYIDLLARYRTGGGITVFGGVRNLTDRALPIVPFGSVGNTYPEYYDALGRRYHLGASLEF
ncbi:MAG: TonB-dependent receptor [Pacificimonas sp.]|jgi:outer membrane receptor protein involved in Fe transport|nr:TonB-dependent receptor [Pacificimonas sp.]